MSVLLLLPAGATAECEAETFSPGDSDVCIPCPDRSNSTAGSTTCTCDVGYAVNGTGINFECSECPAGTVSPDGNACQDCPADSFSVAGAGECFECPGNSTSVAGSATCTCWPGYGGIGFGVMLECPSTAAVPTR